MQDKIMYWMSIVFSALALLLFVVNTTLVNGNRNLQNEVQSRQGSINIATNLAPLNQNLAQALAEFAVTKGDKEIKSLLEAQGITLRDNKDQSAAKKK